MGYPSLTQPGDIPHSATKYWEYSAKYPGEDDLDLCASLFARKYGQEASI
jgi:hypothetical protein